MMNKKGDYKYGVILSLILGVMVLSLSLYFIFQELWSDDELDWEICRQSIQIRSLLPEAEIDMVITDLEIESFKDSYPLKCKTMIVEIGEGDVKDMEKAKKIIAETMARCWALYDKGDSSAFPTKFFKSSTCVSCARIHLTEDAKKYMEEKKITGINIRNSLDLPMTKEYSYYKYLNNSGKKFPAFDIASGMAFDLEGEKFMVDEGGQEGVVLVNRLTGGTENKEWDEIKGTWSPLDFSKVTLPKIFDSKKGDLLINYGIVVSSKESGVGNYMPYLFYFQTNQKEPNPFDEVKKQLVDGFLWSNANFCESWEGIPA